MKISEIYEKYFITPLLQMHQLRAASVGKLILENWNNPSLINKNAIIQTLLLHDMGNIIKFDLENSPHLLAEELPRVDFWKEKQKEFIKKYGKDEHKATHLIGKDLGVSKEVDTLLSQLGSHGLQKAAEEDNFNLKIVFYSDLRCGPFGILSVDKRFDDLLARYKGRNHPIADVARTEGNRKRTLEIEAQLQRFISIKIDLINDLMISDNINSLKSYNL